METFTRDRDAVLAPYTVQFVFLWLLTFPSSKQLRLNRTLVGCGTVITLARIIVFQLPPSHKSW